MNRLRATEALSSTVTKDRTSVPGGDILSEESFRKTICLERKRTERSRKPFVLMLVDTGDTLASERNGKVLLQILHALAFATRETDVRGWYTRNLAVGVMFTEITLNDKKQRYQCRTGAVGRILGDVRLHLIDHFGRELGDLVRDDDLVRKTNWCGCCHKLQFELKSGRRQ